MEEEAFIANDRRIQCEALKDMVAYIEAFFSRALSKSRATNDQT